jgi:hypothetical protein
MKIFTEILNSEKIKDFENVRNHQEAANYFMDFFHKPECLFKSLENDFNEEETYKIFFNTFCYLLGAKKFNIKSLKSCLDKAHREKIAWDILSYPVNETPEDPNLLSAPNEQIFVDNMRNSWILLNDLNQIYLEGLKLRLSKNRISKILIYEAPPFCGTQKIDHFFISKGIYFNVFPKTNSKSKGNDNTKAFLTNVKEMGYQIKFSTQLKDGLDLKGDDRKNDFYNVKDENIEFINNSISSCIEDILSTDIVYLDLTLIPIPLNSELRKEWSTKDEYKISIGENQTASLPVLMFQWAMENLKNELSDNVENEKCSLFDKNCLIAIGTPLNTSSSIFEYYVDQNYEIYNGNFTDISRLNSPTAFKKTRFNGTTFPMFKSNVIGGSGWPDLNLVKNAFNLPE